MGSDCQSLMLSVSVCSRHQTGAKHFQAFHLFTLFAREFRKKPVQTMSVTIRGQIFQLICNSADFFFHEMMRQSVQIKSGEDL